MRLKITVSDVLGNEASKTLSDIDVASQDTDVIAKVEGQRRTVQDALATIVVRAFDAKVFTLVKPGA